MAVKTQTSVTRTHGRIVVKWETLGNADSGTPYEPPVGYTLQNLQFTGTLGGATLSCAGSNDAATYAIIKSETSLGFVVPGTQAVIFRPETSGGTGTDVDVLAYFSAYP